MGHFPVIIFLDRKDVMDKKGVIKEDKAAKEIKKIMEPYERKNCECKFDECDCSYDDKAFCDYYLLGDHCRFSFEDVFESKSSLKLSEFCFIHYILDKSGIIYDYEMIGGKKVQKIIDMKSKDSIVFIIDCHL